MDYHGVVRIGTGLANRKTFTRLRRLVSEIQARNGGRPITDADRAAIAARLKVRVYVVERIEPRLFSGDLVIDTTDAWAAGEELTAALVASGNGCEEVESAIDRRRIMARVHALVNETYEGRDLDIVRARLEGEMTRERYDHFVRRDGITVERIRQIQRGALEMVRDCLSREGVKRGVDSVLG